jgi:L-ribulose-5-phosphate 3-epimerase
MMTAPLNRRNFLKRSSGALALAALAPHGLWATDVPGKKRAIKKGYMMGTFPESKKLTWLEKFKLLKEAGFDGCEPPSFLNQKEILAARDATGLIIASVSGGQHTRAMSDATPAKRKTGTEGLVQALRDAKAYGATSVLCVAGTVNEASPYAAVYERTHDAIKAAVPLAEELGVKIAIENVWNNFLLSPLEAARFVDEFKSPAVGWHFDVGNVMNIGWPEQWIRILGKRIQKLHIKEFSRKKMTENGMRKGFAVEYLEGDNDWPAVMKALDDVGYHGWAIIENACGECKQKLEPEVYLKKISEQLDKILMS